jgi:hypothetical protein
VPSLLSLPAPLPSSLTSLPPLSLRPPGLRRGPWPCKRVQGRRRVPAGQLGEGRREWPRGARGSDVGALGSHLTGCGLCRRRMQGAPPVRLAVRTPPPAGARQRRKRGTQLPSRTQLEAGAEAGPWPSACRAGPPAAGQVESRVQADGPWGQMNLSLSAYGGELQAVVASPGLPVCLRPWSPLQGSQRFDAAARGGSHGR